MNINILVDNRKSWIAPFIDGLVNNLKKKDYYVNYVHNKEDLIDADFTFILGCEKIVERKFLDKSKNNLVVHESDLPGGKGWSPLTWQILEGKNEIPITLFEAEESVDSGNIYIQDVLKFDGTELNNELKKIQGDKTSEMIINFLENFSVLIPRQQVGQESFYRHRTMDNSELDINKTIAEQFNLLRIVDNERYPAFFNYKGHKYIIKIYKDNR